MEKELAPQCQVGLQKFYDDNIDEVRKAKHEDIIEAKERLQLYIQAIREACNK